MSLESRVVLLPGVTGGFGPSLARAFHDAGCRLVLGARREAALKELVAEEKLDAERTLLQVVDVSDPQSVAAMVAQARQRFGRIDVLVNLVGGFKAGKPVHELADEDLEAMFSINLRSMFLTCRAVVPVMLAQGGGRIVNFGSALALRAAAGTAPYAAAKAAVLRLTEAMAEELGPRGIRVNAVVPSTIDTEANRAAMPDADRSSWVKPEQLAQAILFLASDAAAGVNGVSLPVTGGGGGA
jgi:NAD(P)-dependent dehydrogenase (short-subunit alcohol dehydrogenase family)